MGNASCCERESGMSESGGRHERSRAAAATVVTETEPFFRDVMEVYVDLLCRGERDASRLLFRSGVRFAAAVHGMQRAGGLGSASANPADAPRRHLERCLFALWRARQREPHYEDAKQRDMQPPGVDTVALFKRGLAMLSALRAISAHAAADPTADAMVAETAGDAWEKSNRPGAQPGPSIPAPSRERPGHEELHTWIRERTSSPPSR